MSTTFLIFLFLHIFSLLAAIAASGIMIVCAFKLRAAKTGAEAFPWGMLASKTPIVFPIGSAGLILTGAYMASNSPGDAWSWSSGWIIMAIIGLVFVNAEGMIIGGGHGKKLGAALKENGPGPVSAHIKELTNEKLHWAVSLAAPGLVLGIVWNMIEGAALRDPSFLRAIVFMVLGWLAGAAVGVYFSATYKEKAPVAASAPAAQ